MLYTTGLKQIFSAVILFMKNAIVTLFECPRVNALFYVS